MSSVNMLEKARNDRDNALKLQLIAILEDMKQLNDSKSYNAVIDDWLIELSSGRRKVYIDDSISK